MKKSFEQDFAVLNLVAELGAYWKAVTFSKLVQFFSEVLDISVVQRGVNTEYLDTLHFLYSGIDVFVLVEVSVGYAPEDGRIRTETESLSEIQE